MSSYYNQWIKPPQQRRNNKGIQVVQFFVSEHSRNCHGIARTGGGEACGQTSNTFAYDLNNFEQIEVKVKFKRKTGSSFFVTLPKTTPETKTMCFLNSLGWFYPASGTYGALASFCTICPWGCGYIEYPPEVRVLHGKLSPGAELGESVRLEEPSLQDLVVL